MGINGCATKKALWLATGLTLKSLKDLNIGNKIDVDGNALAWKIGCGKSVQEVIQLMASFLKVLAHSGGFNVTIILDGQRPDCKRDTWFRQKERKLDEINKLFCRLKAIELDKKTDKDSIIAFNSFNSEAKRLEKKNSRFVTFPSDFSDRLSERLMMINACSLNENGGIVNEQVIKAKFQADSLIAKRSVDSKSNFILADDSDFAALLGKKCILIKNIKQIYGTDKGRGRRSKWKENESSELHDSTLFSVDMVGSCNERMQELKTRLDENSIYHNDQQWNKAETPIFRYKSNRLRATIALILGCDVYKDGLKNTGRAKVHKVVEDILQNGGTEYDAEKKLQMMFIDGHNDKLNETTMDTLVMSFLYEPGIDGSNDMSNNAINATNDVIGPSSYIFDDVPQCFPRFLHIFAGTNAIVDGPEVLVCNGSSLNGMKKHSYLAFEGAIECSVCHGRFCKSCSFVPKMDKKKTKKSGVESNCKIYYKDCNDDICLNCYRLNRLGGSEDDSISNMDKSLDEMGKELNENFGVQLDPGCSLTETVDIYNTYISSVLNNRSKHLSDIEKKVKWPLLSADSITNISIFCEFDFSSGGRFINEKEMVKDKDLVGVISFLSSCLEHDDIKLIHTSESDVGQYGHFPTMLLNFAFESRVDSGYRLLSRCARHACDPRTSSLHNTRAQLFKYNGKIGILLSHEIQASMKDASYDVQVAFTNEELICCTCNCKAGCVGSDRSVCVHVLPLILLFLIFMLDGFAEHVLVELCHRWDLDQVNLENIVDDKEMELLSSSISQLMMYSGRGGSVSEDKTNVSVLLSSFRVGTEKMKIFNRQPKPDELIPIRLLNIKSNNSMVKSKLSSKPKPSSEPILLCSPCSSPTATTTSTTTVDSSFSPNYVEVEYCIKAMEYVFESYFNEMHTGYRVLKHRSDKMKASEAMNLNLRLEMNKKRIEWKRMLSKAMSRNRESIKRKRDDSFTLFQSCNDPTNNETQSTSNDTFPLPLPTLQQQPQRKKHKRQPLLPLQSTAIISKKDHQRKCSYYCAFKGCNNNNHSKNVSFFRVPSPQNKKLPNIDTSGHRELKCYYKKKLHHHLFLKAMGLKERDWTASGLRICSKHEIKKNVKCSKSIIRKGINHKYDYIFDLPDEVGVHQRKDATAIRKDTPYERSMMRQWDKRRDNLLNKPGHGMEAVQRIIELERLVQNTFESPSLKDTNETVHSHFGLSQSPDERKNNQVRKFKSHIDQSNNNKNDCNHKKNPAVKPMSISDTMIKNRTGFGNEGEMMAFIIVVCNADMEKINSTVTSHLTWYEEWMLYFEAIWGKTHTSWDDLFLERFDLKSRAKMYDIIDSKTDLVLECRRSWPTYVSMEEDEKLRKKKWNDKYKNKRIVMWDDTNIPFTYKPSSALNQRITYSAYYGMNCAKGGVFLQLCGWLGVEELWVGAVSDSHYMRFTSILKRQKIFAQEDTINGEYIPFSNILDKGYRIVRICWREGKQECIQPSFASSDRKFTSSEMLMSATVAADRSGNERAVKISKGSAFLKRGLKPNSCPIRLNNVWMAWSFQANFMYKSVL